MSEMCSDVPRGATLTPAAAMAYPFLTVDASPESSPDAQAPNRPAAVPAVGVWNAEVGKWEVSPRDARGVRDGECLLYRDDGTLYSRSRFVDGVQDGPFFVYHRDGNVAREGQYVAGQLDGTVTAYASEESRRRAACARAACRPARPACASVTARATSCSRCSTTARGARFSPTGGCARRGRRACRSWRSSTSRAAAGRSAAASVDRFWSERRDADRGDRARRRRRAGRAPLRRGGAAAAGGRLHRRRPARRAVLAAFCRRPSRSPTPTRASARSAAPTSAGSRSGRWTFLDAERTGAAHGRSRRRVSRRRRRARRRRRSPTRPATGRRARCRSPRRGACARRWSRRRAARRRPAIGAAFERFRAEHVVPLSPEREAQWGEALAQATDATIASVLDALVSGADAAACFRALASVLPGNSAGRRGAGRGVAAAGARAPDDAPDARVAALPARRSGGRARRRRRRRGRIDGGGRIPAVVRRDRVSRASTTGRGGASSRPIPSSTACVEPAHEPVDEVRHVIGVYATRLDGRAARFGRWRGGARRRAWLPPDLSPLLPARPGRPAARDRRVRSRAGGGVAAGRAAAGVGAAPETDRDRRAAGRPTAPACRRCWRPRTPIGPRSAGCAGRSGWTGVALPDAVARPRRAGASR